MEKQNDNTAEVEMVGLKEVQDQYGRTSTDMNEEEFKLLVKAKTERISNPQVVERWVGGNEDKSFDFNPVSIERI